MTLIEQIKADREAGTAGPWVETHDHPEPAVARSLARIRSKAAMSWDANEIAMVFGCDYTHNGRQEQKHNARRIARVPEMEESLLAAERLADAISLERDARRAYKEAPNDRGGSNGPKGKAQHAWLLSCFATNSALIAFRKAIGVEE